MTDTCLSQENGERSCAIKYAPFMQIQRTAAAAAAAAAVNQVGLASDFFYLKSD